MAKSLPAKPAQAHTPGPWKIEWQNIVTEHPADIGIVVIYGNIGQPVEANARLIAAAPELLQACKLALHIIQLEIYNSGLGEPHQQLKRDVTQITDAITKATGEPSA